MSADRPGPLRRLVLKGFRWAPAWPSHVVVRWLTPTFSMGAVALIEYQGRILALRQLHRRGWSLPGGLLDRGELPEQAVVREVREETGLEVTAGDIFATVVDPGNRHIDVIFRIVSRDEPRIRVASEAVDARWFTLDELPDPDASTRRIVAAVRAVHAQPVPGRVLS